MSLREKYNHAIQTAKGFGMQGSAEEREGKLYFKGTVQSQDQANKIWDAIKTVPTWQKEVVADIKSTGAGAAPQKESTTPHTETATPKQTQATYTVKAGDTLSKIAKEFLGDANAFCRHAVELAGQFHATLGRQRLVESQANVGQDAVALDFHFPQL